MDKTRRKIRKLKNIKTRRRRKIMGGRESGYKAALVLWPSYDLDEEGKPTKFVRFKERFVTMHNLGIKRRTDYIDDWIQLNVENEPLVQENVVPVVHWLTGKHPKKTDATASGTTGSDNTEYLNINSSVYTRIPPFSPDYIPPTASDEAKKKEKQTREKQERDKQEEEKQAREKQEREKQEREKRAEEKPAAAATTPAQSAAAAPQLTKEMANDVKRAAAKQKLNSLYPDKKEKAVKIKKDFLEFENIIGAKYYTNAKEVLLNELIKPDKKEFFDRLMAMEKQ